MALDIVRLHGTRIDLDILETDEESIQLYTKWANDEYINMWIHGNDEIHSVASERQWATNANNSENSNQSYNFTIVEKESRNQIGTCSCGIWGNARNATLGIYIGDENGRGKGYGTEAVKLLVMFCFEELNAHRVELSVFTDNEKAINCYKRVGFKDCGVRHECSYFGGKYRDLMYMEILKREWKG